MNTTSKPTALLATGALSAVLAAGLVVAGPGAGRSTASNHLDAPTQILDNQADVTDMYLFTSPDDPETITAICDWTAFEVPRGILPWYRFITQGHYDFNIDNTGDGKPELTYRYAFSNNDGSADPPPAKGQIPGQLSESTIPWMPEEASENARKAAAAVPRRAAHRSSDQSYSVQLLRPGKPAQTIVGQAATGDWNQRRNRATVKLAGGGATYAGPNRDPFFYWFPTNVHSIALKLPKRHVALNNDPARNPVIGMWTTAHRTSIDLRTGKSETTQVSRQGLSGFSSVVLPLQLRDKYHHDSAPATDPGWKDMTDWLETGATGSLFGVGVLPVLGTGKHLKQMFLTGIADSTGPVKTNLNAHLLNQDADRAKIVPNEQVRLNMSTPHNPKPKRHGFLDGDLQGYPNGRRLTDDTFTAFTRITAGEPAAPPLLGITSLLPVSGLEPPVGEGFPYLHPPI